MKTTPLLLSSFAFGVGGVATFLALDHSAGSRLHAADATVAREPGVDLESAIRALQQSVADLEGQVALVQSVPRTPAKLGQAEIADAVAAYLAQSGSMGTSPTGEEPTPAGPETPEEFLAALMESGTLDATELWKKIVDAGLEEEVLALYKAAADNNPNDPEAQLALGEAYLGITQQMAGSPMAGKYATLADQALDAALKADPQHWEARYTKATALSFWPPIFGKQTAAIQQFETLVEQQGSMAPSPNHAGTHLMLGNMYQQTGQMEKAIQAWQAGLLIFPNHSDLAAQIALASNGSAGGY